MPQKKSGELFMRQRELLQQCHIKTFGGRPMDNKLGSSAVVTTQGKVFHPTQRLRFIERPAPFRDEHTKVKILQQLWIEEEFWGELESYEQEWRDVPF
jgi:hypothetical protein